MHVFEEIVYYRRIFFQQRIKKSKAMQWWPRDQQINRLQKT